MVVIMSVLSTLVCQLVSRLALRSLTPHCGLSDSRRVLAIPLNDWPGFYRKIHSFVGLLEAFDGLKNGIKSMDGTVLDIGPLSNLVRN